ncbi:hypothetical protein [Psychromonas arctica]|uniref:hypothetical protein n=1 Tax=Psychromonas arctica TaxID=168275 RepID=UPI00048E475C|nr:hypothetical protein [Psychromonas arctica]
MKLNKSELATLNVLMKSSKGLDTFTLFRRLNFSFSEYSKIIRILSGKGMINEHQEDFLKITLIGKKYITQQNKVISDKPWRKVPTHFLGEKLTKNSLYIPSIKLLDKKTFKIDKDELY